MSDIKYINKFETTEEFNQAISEDGTLSSLEHFMAYDAQNDVFSIKPLPKPIAKTMKFVYGENEIQLLTALIGDIKTCPLIARKDLFKSIKYNGEELLTEPTVDPIDWNILTGMTGGEPIQEYYKQSALMYIIMNMDESGNPTEWKSEYVLTIEEVLGRFPEVGDEILLEVEFKDGLTDLSAMHFIYCLGLTEISSNLFEDCTEVTNFACAFDCSMLIDTYTHPLTSSCPIDKDGTPLYNRSNGKEGYATVTVSEGCFNGCTNMSDYASIPDEWKISVEATSNMLKLK